MWPAVVMAALMAVVWYWGVPAEQVLAQSLPVLELEAETLTIEGVAVEGDTLKVSASGYDSGERIWFYLWTRDDGVDSFPNCLDVAVDEYLIREGRLDTAGSASFDMEVSVPPFVEGDNNMLCAVRRGGQYATAYLEVDVPPDTYLMQLELTEINAAGTVARNTLIPDDALSDHFEVVGARGLSEWDGTQSRGVDADSDSSIEGDEVLVQTSGEWRACPLRGSLNVGCEWDDLSGSGALLVDRSGSHLVPGEDMVLQLSLPDAAGGNDLNLAAERFVVFWGPVDVWLLGTERDGVTGGVPAEDFVVHDEHLRPLASELNSKIVQLRPGDTVDLPISWSSSANEQGHTFISMVACNDNYLKRLFGTGAVTGEVADQLQGLEDCTVQQGPAFEDYGTNLSPDASYLVRSGEHYLRQAWVQHDVHSGFGLHCSVTPTVYSDWVEIDDEGNGYWEDTWHLDVKCVNGPVPDPVGADSGTEDCYTSLTQEYSWASSPSIDTTLGDVARMAPIPPVPATETDPGSPGRPAVSGVDQRATTNYWCGWEPEHFKDAVYGPAPRGYNLSWYNTRYNAANSFYSFALEWELDRPPGGDGYGCGAMLLPHIYGVAKYRDTSRWEVGSLPVSKCEAEPGVNSVDVGLLAPRPPALDLSRFNAMSEPAKSLAEYRARQTYELAWGRFPDHSMHFAVYVSGMPTVFDYRRPGDDDVAGEEPEFRLVSLGSWSYDEEGVARSGSEGGRALLGVAHPIGAGVESEEGAGVLDAVPSVGELYGGRSFTVTRDYANRDGHVEIYVVPCRPLQSANVPVVDEVQGACEHLPPGNGQVLGVTFDGGDSSRISEDGPFGLSEPAADERDYTLDYSFKFTVRFRGSAWRDQEERAVSLPLETVQSSDGDCSVHSALDRGVLYWPEVVVDGGACESDSLGVVEVKLVNDGRHGVAAEGNRPDQGGRDDRLVVYVTGGRSSGLDQVPIWEAGLTYDSATRLGRLGVRERRLALDYDGSGAIHVSPDLANEAGDVFLLVYSCGEDRFHGTVGHCPLTRRQFQNVPVYDVPVPPSFVVQVRFTAESGLLHTDLGPVCQGDDCDPLVPVLREAVPEVPGVPCGVSSYMGSSSDLLYWPDRLVRGGGCMPHGLTPVSVDVSNVSGAESQDLVLYATGGRTPGWETVQVGRGGAGGDAQDALSDPAGAAGLRRVQLGLDGGDSGQVLVGPDLADQNGKVLLLAYLCSSSSNCPGEPGSDGITFLVDRRPLFQVLVEYDPNLLSFTDFAICRGDSCVESYPLGRVSRPSGNNCAVSASYSEGELYWPDGVVAGGGCESNVLDDVSVSFSLPSEAGDGQSLTVYVTGGRMAGLDEVTVRRADSSAGQDANSGYRGYLVPEQVVFAPDPAAGGDWDANLVSGTLLSEHNTVNMRWLSVSHPDLYAVLEAKSWVMDGLSDVEKSALDYLLFLAVREWSTADAATRVADMPFLDEVDQADYLTLRGLNRAAAVGMVYDIIDHATLSGGIEDSERVLVMGVSAMADSAKITSRLSSGYSNVETRTYSTARTGTLSVTVVRTSADRQSYVANHVAASVEDVEDVMDAPLPVSYVVLFMDKDLVVPGADGVNYGYAISYNPDRETASGTRDSDILKSGIVHEVAHYFWRGSQGWVDEGLASAFQFVLGTGFGISEDLLRWERRGCDIPNLRSLVEAYPISLVSPQGICDYYLGQRLFLDLRDSLGDADFNAGLRRLYASVKECHLAFGGEECGTVDQVRVAFPDSGEIIDLHWGAVAVGPSGDEGDEGRLGRLGLRESLLTLEPGGSGDVLVSPDLAAENGEVWLLAYSCVGAHGDRGCPLVARPADNGYDLPKGPEFAVRVKFTEESGLTHSTLGPICQGDNCAPLVPVLREAGPADDVGVGVCGAASYRGGGGRVYWPDRVILGGACDRPDLGDVPVSIRNVSIDGGQQLALYATGGRSSGLDLVRVRRGGASGDVAGVPFGRMGLRRVDLSVGPDELKTVLVSPDLADQDGNVWLLAYLCDDGSCPEALAGDDLESYAVARRPLFQLRVRFPSVEGAELREICRGRQCDIAHPWLRLAEPSVSECSVQLGAHWDFWPDRVVRGGGCYFRGAHYGLVDFGAEGEEKFVVYTTGGVRSGLELVPVYGLLGKDDNAEEEQLGRSGLRETRVELAPGGKEQVWVRSDMADDDGNVWLFVYRCLTTYGDDGCPLVGRDAIRPSYDVPIRPAFVVRVGFLSTADRDQSSFVVVCPPDSGSCRLTAIFRDSEGNSLPGTVEFRVDRGSLGEAGSTVASSQRGHTRAGDGEYKFEETLHLPASGGVVNIQAELLGDGLILRQQAGSAGAVDRISVRVMRCSGDGDSCHDDGLEEVDDLLAGDHFVLGVTGYDAAGARVFDTGRVSDTYCANGPTGLGAEFRLKSRHLKSHVYGVATQPDDRGYTGCAIRVSDDAPSGTYSISVSYGSMTVQAQILVVVDTSGFGFLGLTGPAQLKSGESREYTVRGYTLSGEASAFDGGCLELSLTGALESAESGSGTDGCLAEELPEGGFKFTVKAQEGVIYSTDSSVGVTYEGRTKVKHVLVVPAEDEAAPPPVAPSSSRITDLTITPEGPQLRVSWTGSPTADFESLRAQVWLVIGGEDVFLPGCMGGEPHDVSTYEAFCMLSYGQSGDVYHAAVGFLRHDGSSVPVETAQWVRP